MPDRMKIAGFGRDEGNWSVYGRHGVSRKEIEEMFTGTNAVLADRFPDEARQRGIENSAIGRYVSVVFMLRDVEDETKLRPISARYMHQKEIAHHEGRSWILAAPAQRCRGRGVCRNG